MNEVRQGWLVASREIRERSRSRAFLISVVFMIVAVVATLTLPALIKPDGSKTVGLVGAAPAALGATVTRQARLAGTSARIQHYSSIAAGERAVRQGKLDVLVIGMRQLEWKGRADQVIHAVVTQAIQQVTVRQRASAAGIGPDALGALLAPAPIKNVELGPTAGRSPSDETAVFAMTVLLFFCISVFGSMVLTGVLEEKTNRVVEVLLARMPARVLLAGKIAGIGLLGLAQVAVTAAAALIVVATVRSIDIPAVRGTVLVWAVAWFLLGYLLYAAMYGALGSLGSRAEDAQSLAAPTSVVLVAGYFASFAMIAQPASALARAISYFPLTAPMAMPGRIAMGAAAWWEPVVAATLTLATIAGTVWLAGRVYTGAILHSGPALSLREAWRHRSLAAQESPPGASDGQARVLARPRTHPLTVRRLAMSSADNTSHRWLLTVLTIAGVIVGVVVAVITSDVILGVIAGSALIAISVQTVRLWTGHNGPPVAHR